MSRLLSLACLLFAAVPLASHAAPPRLTADASEVREALRQASSPRGAASLLRLHAQRDQLADLAPLARLYEQVASRRGADAGTRATAQLLLLDTQRAQGRTQEAAATLGRLGFVSDFYVAGGFDNEGKAGCDTAQGPEGRDLDLGAAYPAARGRAARWRKLPFTSTDGYVDLSAAIRPNREVVAYAMTYLDAPAPTRATLALGTSGAFRLFVNGEPAASGDRYNLPRPDQTRVSVQLRRGLNRVVLKVCQSAGPLGFYLRQESPSAARAVLPESLPPLTPGLAPAPGPLPTVSSALAEAVQKRPRDAALRGDHAVALAYFRSFDEKDHAITVEAARAAELAPRDVRLQLFAGAAHGEDFNARRRFLEAALKAAPDSVEARVELARHELDREHPERARPLLEEALKREPLSVPARLALVRTLEAQGETPRAHALIEETYRALPRIPSVVRAAATAARLLGRPAESIERLREAVALRADDRGSRRALASQLADLAQVDAAAREMRDLLALDPSDNGIRLSLAEFEAANGRREAASQLFADAKALASDEPDVHEREGRALLAAGRRTEALSAFERALALRPQNPGLKEALRTLKGEGPAAGGQYVLDVRPLMREADAYANEDAVYLVDGTFVRVQQTGVSSRLHQTAVKVLNARGVEAFRSFPISYSPDRQEVRVLKARVTRPDGSVVETHSESDRNLNEPWTGMYYDARAKVLGFPSLAPGDVLELVYRVDDTAADNLLSDYWGNVDSVQSTYPKLRYQFVVEMPRERPLYWNSRELPGVTHESKALDDGRQLYRWSAKSVSKVVPEPSMPGWAEVSSTLHVSTYKTWEQVGRYYWGLVRDQLTPDAELQKTVDGLLAGMDRKDELAVVRKLYNFVVTHTRYVALEFGIHGYKPYRVDRVLARRFGDCKDKASLIHAMLRVAGVDSKLVLLRMRHLGKLGEEPASLAAFNHAILYVPRFDLYLDGTAEFHGAKELPSSDRVANVLIIEPGGKSTFLTTPEARAEDNATKLKMGVALKPDGSAEVTGASEVTGVHAPDYRRAYQAQSSRRSTFERSWAQSFPGLTVSEVKLSDTTQLDRDVQVDFRMSIPRYAEAPSGTLRFLPFGAGRSYAQAYASLAQRRFDLVMPSPWTNRFEVRHTLPPGYTLKDLPEETTEESPFGRVRLTHRLESGVVVSEGEVSLTQARVRAEDYAAFRAFLIRVDQAFGRKLVATGSSGPTAGR